MKLSLRRKVLLSVGVVAGIGALAGMGTFATFTAQTTNPSNTFANGTLVLSNTVGATTCLSTGGGATDSNENTACATLFDFGVQAPDDSDTADLTLANVGSVDASVLKAFSAGCTPDNADGENYHGTGDPCDVVQLYIQQYSDAFVTPSDCLYGGGTAQTCDFSDTDQTLADFVSTHSDEGTGLSAGPLEAANVGDSDMTWIRIGVRLPDTVDNSYQGRSATMALNWRITQ